MSLSRNDLNENEEKKIDQNFHDIENIPQDIQDDNGLEDFIKETQNNPLSGRTDKQPLISGQGSIHSYLAKEFPQNLDGQKESCQFRCPRCQHVSYSDVITEPNCLTWVYAAFGMSCCLCWLPFIIKDCKDVKHYCPRSKCKKVHYQVGMTRQSPC